MIWPDISSDVTVVPRVIRDGWHLCSARYTDEERDAQAVRLTTMDHADIRGLATAFHLSVAGLPQSSVGDHPMDAHISCSRIPLIGPGHRVAPP
jgi:hypothetical protein